MGRTHNPDTPPALWVGQLLHGACLAVLLALAAVAWTLLGKPFPVAFWSAIAVPVVHQVFVWLSWRLELASSATARTIGFQAYLACFFVLLGGRVVSVLALASIDRGSLSLPMITRAITTLILSLIWVYAAHSIHRHFGFVRGAGADHFDPGYRTKPLVKEGIFRLTSNGMYVYGFVIFWAIAIGFNSVAALTVAAFSHAYIWVHFYATEKPDMNYIYASARKPS